MAKADLGSAVPRQTEDPGAADPMAPRRAGVAGIGDPGRRVGGVSTDAGRRRRRRPRWERRYLGCVVAADLVVGLAAGTVSAQARLGAQPSALGPAVLEFAVLPAAFVAAMAANRAYERRYLFEGKQEYERVVRACLALTALAALGSSAAGSLSAIDHLVVVLPVAGLVSLGARLWLRRRLRRARETGGCMRRVLVVGHPAPVAHLAGQLRRERNHGFDVVGACVPAAGEGFEVVTGVDLPVFGSFSGVGAAVTAVRADLVLVMPCPELDGHALRRLAWQVERDDVDLVVASSLVDVAGARTTIRPVGGLPMLHVKHPELVGGRRAVKAILDRMGALVMIIGLSPVLVAIALVVLLSSGRPFLFRQVRVGKDGRRFTMVKFRTMYHDAPARLATLRANNDCDGVLFKLRDDPRVTRVGGWLRRFSLDELPQLINVLSGQMSLVGPRPPLPEEVASYPEDLRRRLVVRPGMTGLWQVSGRSDLPWEEAVRLDLRYVENWTLSLDLVILLRTLVAIVRPSGAY